MIRKARPDQPCSSLRPYRWPHTRALGDVRQLNDQLLESVAEWTRINRESAGLVLGGHGSVLAGMDPAARRRAASVPILLLDLRFADVGWWTSAARAGDHSFGSTRCEPPAYPWQAPLTREVLMVVWSALREDLSSAALLFGVSAPVATLIESFPPRQIDIVGATYCAELKPRFNDNPSFWRRLLVSATARDESALSAMHVYALQLVAGEILGVSENCTGRKRPVQAAGTHRSLSLASS